ncbi:hypothetical protein FQN57_005403 [Myotisia sp. PD_48]|nr:hypothetical protein FQN57_005403 [Myotisia sp. PD_48]
MKTSFGTLVLALQVFTVMALPEPKPEAKTLETLSSDAAAALNELSGNAGATGYRQLAAVPHA